MGIPYRWQWEIEGKSKEEFMKEKTLLELKNKVETLGKVHNIVAQELNMIKDLAVGTSELIKKLPCYEDALKQLKEEYDKSQEQAKEAEGSDPGLDIGA